MKPGDLARRKMPGVLMYRTLERREFMREIAYGEILLVVGSACSPSDVPYYNVLVGGDLGWIAHHLIEEVLQ